MGISLLWIFDLIGTIAFAVSGAFVGINREMDLLGVNVLAICTACGGGFLRDIIIGRIPPVMFTDPFYVLIAAITANIVFVYVYIKQRNKVGVSDSLLQIYDRVMFWFDSLGLASFTVNGVMAGINAGYAEKWFLLLCVGVLTAVGGGAIRDLLATQLPYIFVKHVYALASVAGAIVMIVLILLGVSTQISMLCGFVVVLAMRFFANRYKWNLPKIVSGEK